MTREAETSRRRFLSRAVAAGAAIGLGACDRLSQDSDSRSILYAAETLTRSVQRALIGSRQNLAPEYSEADISKVFKPNGSTEPDDPDYVKAREANFANWKLVVDGLVEKPQQLSLKDLRALPSRTQITRHDCVEGWSCIGKWTGVALREVLGLSGLKPNARFVVFYCADTLEQTLDGTGQYYESIDLVDAFHPQTILAYDMNGAVLPVEHGAPIRLRVERQLGYKMAKYVMRIEAREEFASHGRGRGGFWEDRGYEWYAGI
jgi:DMSO/TMAO reductase YedYZ molybdopterin-dependent catalytic subunit